MGLSRQQRQLQRRQLLALGLLSAAATPILLQGCANDSPTVVRLDESELQALVAKGFPRKQRVLEVFDAGFQAPQVRLLAAQNRLAAKMPFELRDRVLGAAWRGEIDVDGLLRWNAADQTVRLAQVQVQALKLASGGPAQRLVERLGPFVAESLLDDLVVWQLQGEQAERLQRHGRVPSAVTVTARGVEITLVPVGQVQPPVPAPVPAARPDVPRPQTPPRSGSV
ncbi:MAG: hypothetical protein ACOVOT_14580 [Rubrivivax sp.]|jgi:hypothetical protein|nr:hypothetical protein [Rubrivivax sp.]